MRSRPVGTTAARLGLTLALIGGTTAISGTATASGILWNNGGVLAAGPATTDGSGNIFPPSLAGSSLGSVTLAFANVWGRNFNSDGNLGLGANGVGYWRVIGSNGNFTNTGSGAQTIGLSAGTGTSDVILSRAAAANWRFGDAAVDTAPVAQTLSVQNVLAGGTSNVAGANFTIAGSQGKGTGAGGSIIFQTAPAGSTGTTVNALATALTIDSTGLATFAGGVQVTGTAYYNGTPTNAVFGVNSNNAVMWQSGWYGFSPSSNLTTATDVNINRASAGNLRIGTTGLNASGSLSLANLTMSGVLQLGNAYVGTPGVSTGTVTIKDSTGATYKVLVST